MCGFMIRGESLHSPCLIEANSVPLAILALYIPPLYTVQSKRLTEWGESERDRSEGGRGCSKERKTT